MPGIGLWSKVKAGIAFPVKCRACGASLALESKHNLLSLLWDGPQIFYILVVLAASAHYESWWPAVVYLLAHVIFDISQAALLPLRSLSDIEVMKSKRRTIFFYMAVGTLIIIWGLFWMGI